MKRARALDGTFVNDNITLSILYGLTQRRDCGPFRSPCRHRMRVKNKNTKHLQSIFHALVTFLFLYLSHNIIILLRAVTVIVVAGR